MIITIIQEIMQTFVPNKLHGQLLEISFKNFTFLKTFNSEFSYIEVCLLFKILSLDIEDKINIILVIK